jgi:hypothetical protein
MNAPGFTAEQALITPAACSYEYGDCAGPLSISCVIDPDGNGICTGTGYALYRATCDDRTSYSGEAPASPSLAS